MVLPSPSFPLLYHLQFLLQETINLGMSNSSLPQAAGTTNGRVIYIPIIFVCVCAAYLSSPSVLNWNPYLLFYRPISEVTGISAGTGLPVSPRSILSPPAPQAVSSPTSPDAALAAVVSARLDALEALTHGLSAANTANVSV